MGIYYSLEADTALQYAVPQLYTKSTQPIPEDIGMVQDIAYSSNGKTLLISGVKFITVDVETGEIVHAYERYAANGQQLIGLNGGQRFIASTHGINQEDLLTGEVLMRFPFSNQFNVRFATDSTQNFLIAGSQGRYNLWDISTGVIVEQFGNGNESSNRIQSERLNISTTTDGILVDNQRTLEEPRLLTGHNGSIRVIHISQDENYLSGIDTEGDLIVWNVVTGDLYFRYPLNAVMWGNTRYLEFSSDNSLLAANDGSGRIYIIDMSSQRVLRVLTSPSLRHFSISPDGTTVSTIDGNSIRFWDTGQTQLPSVNVESFLMNIQVSFDGNRIQAVGRQGEIHEWDVITQRSVELYKPSNTDEENEITIVALNDNGDLVAVADTDQITIRHTRQDEELYRIQEQLVPVTALAFNRHPSLLVSGHEDGSIRLWDLDNEGSSINETKVSDSPITMLEMSHDSQLLAVGDRLGKVFVWSLGDESATLLNVVDTKEDYGIKN